MGVMFAGAAVARKLGYEVGVFNGSGESIRQNNRSQLWAGRIFVDPLGAYTLAEGSSDATERPVVHVGVGAHGGKAIRGRTTAGVVDEADNQLAYNVEFAFKSPRFDATAEHFWMTDEQQNPVSAPDLDSRGYHARPSARGWLPGRTCRTRNCESSGRSSSNAPAGTPTTGTLRRVRFRLRT